MKRYVFGWIIFGSWIGYTVLLYQASPVRPSSVTGNLWAISSGGDAPHFATLLQFIPIVALPTALAILVVWMLLWKKNQP